MALSQYFVILIFLVNLCTCTQSQKVEELDVMDNTCMLQAQIPLIENDAVLSHSELKDSGLGSDLGGVSHKKQFGASTIMATTRPDTGKKVLDDIIPTKFWLAAENVMLRERQRLRDGSSYGAKPKYPLVHGSIFEAVSISLPLEPPLIKYPQNSRGFHDADKNIAGMKSLASTGNCVVYGIGVANNADFEEQMARDGCDVHAFDCTVSPTSPEVLNKRFTFHNWCIGQKGNFSLSSTSQYFQQSKGQDFAFKSLAETQRLLGHPRISLLKFDIEGFEWQLFEQEILASHMLPWQIAFELHTQKADPNWIPQELVKDKDFVEVNKLFLRLYDLGYRVISKEINDGDPACAEFVAVHQ